MTVIHSVAFFDHRSFGSDAILIDQMSFHSSVCFKPARDFDCFHPVNDCRFTSLHVIQSIPPLQFQLCQPLHRHLS